jgi:hypothetical protein
VVLGFSKSASQTNAGRLEHSRAALCKKNRPKKLARSPPEKKKTRPRQKKKCSHAWCWARQSLPRRDRPRAVRDRGFGRSLWGWWGLGPLRGGGLLLSRAPARFRRAVAWRRARRLRRAPGVPRLLGVTLGVERLDHAIDQRRAPQTPSQVPLTDVLGTVLLPAALVLVDRLAAAERVIRPAPAAAAAAARIRLSLFPAHIATSLSKRREEPEDGITIIIIIITITHTHTLYKVTHTLTFSYVLTPPPQATDYSSADQDQTS